MSFPHLRHILSLLFIGIVSLVLTVPTFQIHAFYLHRLPLARTKLLGTPEAFGFLPKQVTSFSIRTSNGDTLHTWYIPLLDLVQRKQQELLAEAPGRIVDDTSALACRFLRQNPDGRLVLAFNGMVGCIASGYRLASYQVFSSFALNMIHVLAFECDGFGLSSGQPSEKGLILDFLAITGWVVDVAGIPTWRIVLFGHSLCAAVILPSRKRAPS